MRFDCIPQVGNGLAVVGGQLISPAFVAVGIGIGGGGETAVGVVLVFGQGDATHLYGFASVPAVISEAVGGRGSADLDKLAILVISVCFLKRYYARFSKSASIITYLYNYPPCKNNKIAALSILLYNGFR